MQTSYARTPDALRFRYRLERLNCSREDIVRMYSKYQSLRPEMEMSICPCTPHEKLALVYKARLERQLEGLATSPYPDYVELYEQKALLTDLRHATEYFWYSVYDRLLSRYPHLTCCLSEISIRQGGVIAAPLLLMKALLPRDHP